MTEFLIANMAPIMFSALVLFLLLGYPVAFSLAAVGMTFGLIGIDLGLLTPNLLQAFPDRIFGIMKNEILLAVPFFTFMGFANLAVAFLLNLSTEVWVNFKLFGGIGLMLLFVLAQGLMLSKYITEEDK